VFNSVNITGTDVINGQALEVTGGTNYTVKNNIFANNGGGYAAYVTSPISSFSMDNNDYFSTKRRVAYFQNTTIDTLSVFSALTGKDVNSKSVNPFYISTTNLQPNHTLLNGTGTAVATVTTDIDNALRAAAPDMGAKEFSPCGNDAGLNEFWALSNPLPVGNSTIKAVLQNQGTNTLTSATIQWQVNGVAQPEYNWTGSLAAQQNTIVNIGSYNFPAGSTFQLKAWTVGASGLVDCNNYNDTTRIFDLGTPLCGVYTIGGVNPNFTNFYEASVALNNAGVACPVVFKVRNGTYNEQVKIYDIPGASALNTVLFEGENGDSTLAEIHYQSTNPSNDFTVSLTGADYVSFRKLGVRRTNGTYAMRIENNAHHITAQNCKLGNVISPATSCDSVLTFRYNNMQGFDLNLQNPDTGPKATNITVENNYLNSLVINNSRYVSIRNNRNNADTASYAVDFTIDKSRNLTVQGNRMRRLYMTRDTTISVTSNRVYDFANQCCDIRGILINESFGANISSNIVYNQNSVRNRGIDVLNTKTVSILNNSITVNTRGSDWGMGVYVEGSDTRNVTIKNNTINNLYYSSTSSNFTFFGIYMDGGDSVVVRKNTLNGGGFDKLGYGISCYNITNTLEVDSNTVSNYRTEGIHSRPTNNSNWKIRYNTITNVQDAGMFLEGDGSAQYIGNRITGIQAGTGIVVNGLNALVANNYIQSQGLGLSKGISLRSGGTGSSVVFNSVNITGTDVINGQALEVTGGTNYTVKNNIFANNGGGYAAYITSLPAVRDWDYNCYYSTSTNFGFFNNTNYSQIGTWGAAISSDANSKKLNPFYQSAVDLLPFQKQINGAATAAANVLLDIDGELRNQQAPDIGAQEFMVDFGITRLISPSNTCAQSDDTPVRVYLRQFGDIPFINLKIAYQVNNGPINLDTIPGSISNDIEYTFQDPQDLSVAGLYEFKIWLVENGDDNINNDTLRVTRMNKPAPTVDFSFITQCANASVPFFGNASVSPGFIDRYEWMFGDSTLGLGQNPVHIYNLSGTYNVTLQAYSDQGCYSEITKSVTLNPTPDANFTVSNGCVNNAISPDNATVMAGGNGTISYSWNWGDGSTSSGFEPQHSYVQDDTYSILLTATSDNGCTDTVSSFITINALPQLSIDLGTQYLVTSGTVPLNPTPAGGVLTGAGIIGTNFIPALAGIGTHVIRYTYTSPITGCSAFIERVVTIVDGNIAPEITTDISSDTICEGTNYTLIIQATGIPLNYQWYLNGATIPGANASSLVISSTVGSVEYFVRVYNSADTVQSATATITVLPTETYYADIDGDGFGDAGNSVSSCDGQPQGYVTDNTDCDDTNAAVFIGASCDDGDVCTEGDVVRGDCNCAGTYADDDQDGTCNALDLCAFGPEPGTACDDNNPCTFNDSVQDDCTCVGQPSEPETSLESAHACEPYEWNGQVYTESGTYTYSATNAMGCDSIATLELTVGAPSSSTTTINACNGYTWNEQAYTQSGTYTFVTPNTSGCDSTATLVLTIQNPSVAPTAINASAPSVTVGGSVTLSVVGGTLGTGAQWKWYSQSCGGQFIGTGNSLTVTVNATTTYFVRAEGVCNVTGCASVTITANAIPCGPQSVAASALSVCYGSSTTLTVSGQLNAGASWKWYKNACGSGFVLGTGSSLAVLPTGTTTYFVRAEGGTCGITSCQSITITVNPAPAQPAFIQGPVNGLCGLQGVSYSTPAVSGASSYVWSLPTGATIVSGQGTNAIVVNFGSSLGINTVCGATSICVRSVSACGSSALRCVNLSVAPATPGAITGQSIVCRTQSYTYSIAAVAGATSYTWTVPSTWQITSGQGTTSITVVAGTMNGEVRVSASNTCGSSKIARRSVTTFACSNPGMTMLDEMPELALWPNPAQEVVHLDVDQVIPDKMEIYDMLGKRMYEGAWELEFDVTSWPSGIYFVRVSLGEKQLIQRLEIAH
jgi:PKD repeat protein